ncbi:NmrA family NAD(P)-binding protein [Streptomyces luteogriseus]|uniref:NmrA family NAD(P)-binding protein n=1 Tax=Streptomyces luteogriseus TaxID=68233 RepID=UPI0033CA148B
MNNLLHYADAEGERLLALPAKPEKPIQLIASDDSGFFAATAFDEPDTYLGRQIELAGDEITFPEIAKVYERVTGVPSRFQPKPIRGPHVRMVRGGRLSGGHPSPAQGAPRPADLRGVPDPAAGLRRPGLRAERNRTVRAAATSSFGPPETLRLTEVAHGRLDRH